ncbi:insulin-like growth factor-binding protein 2 isoform X2 [Siniperca chuatsi]|nr:insulin-like growth factor-binding protein 2 isoform X2 [Siniperca chuatsi]XP_044069342.1 insulin-like growth factor-binding protein 2 isoform X2 [Siniperca chuatsi]XP_044069343.1 insulin-like growth factor-binding protein 2 isoform X2 [Siniperca chuatsi]
MSDPETQTQPLIGAASQQTAIYIPSTQGGRSSRAYKVAGLTLLACVLIAGQAMIAYFLLSQRSDIKSLEEQSNNLKAELTKGRSDAVHPMRMHIPMNAPKLMDDFVDEEASTGVPEKTAPPHITECQLEAAGMKAPQVPGFRPVCDERGFYLTEQCYMKHCWCVNPANGQTIPGSLHNGPASCNTSVTGSLSKVMTLPDVSV